MTGYYDGATHGLLQFGDDGPVFRFDLADPEWEEKGPSSVERTYTLRSLPADALDRFAAAIVPYITPRWPAWCPVWHFPTPEIWREVETRTDAILAQAGPPEWTITTSDFATFASFRAERPAVRQGA
jgi:hypothetical protein